jgi:hypothetical protein
LPFDAEVTALHFLQSKLMTYGVAAGVLALFSSCNGSLARKEEKRGGKMSICDEYFPNFLVQEELQ